MSLTPDPVTFMTNLATQIAVAVNILAVAQGVPNWLPASSITRHTPPDTYPDSSPLPFGILRAPQHSTASADVSQTTGNTPGKPNRYRLLYFDAPYVASVTRGTEEDRAINTYAAIATYFKPPDGSEFCLPDTTTFVQEVAMVQNIAGPFVQLGSAIYIGIAIDISVVEEYS